MDELCSLPLIGEQVMRMRMRGVSLGGLESQKKLNFVVFFEPETSFTEPSIRVHFTAQPTIQTHLDKLATIF